MIRLGRTYRQLHTFHSVITPPVVRHGNLANKAIARSSQVSCLFALRYSVQTQTRERKVRVSPPSKSLSAVLPPRTLLGQASLSLAMRDLVNIAALGTSAALAANASPKKPERDVNRNVARQEDECPVGSTDEVYQEAVRKLNSLQSNAKTLDAIRKNRDMGAYKNIPDVIDYASRVGISLDRLDDLSCIHVAGTKGKGSVCALSESLLRTSGFRTGFYSSPHLVEVRERIRINGRPLPKEDFAKHFFTVFNRLEATKDQYEGKMPAYFRFLTIMAFHTFLEEKVDVAVIEVGIGGEYDCTNIIRKPVVVGITSLGLDHTSVLGNTIEKIAWQKAGIIKMGRPAFTVPQPGGAVEVIKERAREKGAPLRVVPSLMSYDFHGHDATLGLAGMHQHLNAALALQLAKTWVTEEHPGKMSFDDEDEPANKQPRIADTLPFSDDVLSGADVPLADAFSLPEQFERGLKSCYWAGRNQVIRREKVTYYLDGAHTPRSITACCKWFRQQAETEARGLSGPVVRILVFNSTGDRDEYSLLPKLVACGFHGAAFCPNIISLYSHDSSADSMNYTTTTERQMNRCYKNLVAFQNLQKQLQGDVKYNTSSASSAIQSNSTDTSHTSGFHQNQDSLPTPSSEVDQSPSMCSQSGDGTLTAFVGGTSSDQFVAAKLVKLPSIIDALQWAACCKDKSLSSPSIHDPTPSDQAIAANHIQVLVTGSIHLVGGVISILDPKLALEPKVD